MNTIKSGVLTHLDKSPPSYQPLSASRTEDMKKRMLKKGFKVEKRMETL